ncbi:MAG: NADH-quinone oxidoreductase subunit L [Algicola sp.]|nr:NADH-quinone oxidoreductase subunit L [Algicola sp.]
MQIPDSLLMFIPLLPLISSLILIFVNPPKKMVTLLGVGSVGLAALIALLFNISLWGQTDFVIRAGFGNWMTIDKLVINFDFYLDALSLVMISIITGVGFFIHLYSTGFMDEDTDYRRYFAYLNMFVSAMLILVLADNMLLLYLGWEGVGLCSYLLIGFWYKNRDNNMAANKAFLITRIGDTGMAIGLFLLFYQLGTLNIQDMQVQAAAVWAPGNDMATLCCLLLLAGAVGKSAQLPLQNWLPDAMAGPTPVSALIHAATMVTAGVYLIARNTQLFQLSPDAMFAVALVGTFTLLLAATAAMVQNDVKRILAYSTISQIGYMFLALGVGAGSVAVFHLMTHAFFKALLFLSAGALIYSVHHEHNIFKMGGLLKKLPVVAASFAVGCAALASLPFTSGFFSKESILEKIVDSGHTELWWAAVAGAFITAFYSGRLFFVVFLGKMQQKPNHTPTKTMHIALLVLIVPSIFAWMQPQGLVALMPGLPSKGLSVLQHWLPIFTPIAALALAFGLYRANFFGSELKSPVLRNIHQLLKSGWGFDFIYHHLFVLPFKWLCHINRNDIIDLFYRRLEDTARLLHGFVTSFQNGRLRSYSASLVLFCVLAISWVVLK